MSVSRDILDSEPPTLTEVTVTIRQRSAGVYNCTVSNARVEDGTITFDRTSMTATPGFATITLNGIIINYVYKIAKVILLVQLMNLQLTLLLIQLMIAFMSPGLLQLLQCQVMRCSM